MDRFPVYPVALRLEGVACLVVGGGRIAARKVEGLLGCGADVTVVAPSFVFGLEDCGARLMPRRYMRSDLEGVRLVVAATGDAAVDHAVYDDAESAGVLANCADDPGWCRFFLPAVLRRGPVTVSVSTGGRSPYLAGWVRDRVAAQLPEDLEELALVVANTRDTLKSAGSPTERAAWSALVDDELLADLAEGNRGAVKARVAAWIDSQLDAAPGGRRRAG